MIIASQFASWQQCDGKGSDEGLILKDSIIHKYIQKFNRNDDELYPQYIPDKDAEAFLSQNIPLFECPDKQMEETYYFRWWTYRKHIKKTNDGFVITEFLPDVPWAGKDNAISCPAAYHFYEGRWLHNQEYLDSYAEYWFHRGGNPRSYSFWPADALYKFYLVTGNKKLLQKLFPDLEKNLQSWIDEKYDNRKDLFWQSDDRDGMEVSVSGSQSKGGIGYRPTINSYMFAEASALAKISQILGVKSKAEYYSEKAEQFRNDILLKLWNKEDAFFEVIPKNGKDTFSGVREIIGYTPWAFNIPADCEEYSLAWKQLMSRDGFFAPYGPTTTEQRSPGFKISYEGHECQWDGPSWPYSTSMTLLAMSELLNNYHQKYVSKADFFTLLKIYSESHQLTENGKTINWIDENLNPYTGDWIARTRLKNWENGSWSKAKGGIERGKDYNHSTFCDIIISDLIGFKPFPDGSFEIDPLITESEWNYFCLDKLYYRNHNLCIMYDKTGMKYNRGKGLIIWVDGKRIYNEENLDPVKINKNGSLWGST